VSKALTTVVIIAVLTSLLAVIVDLPSPTPYSPFNNGSLGYSELVEISNAQVISTINDVESLDRGGTVLILPLVKELSNETYSIFKELVSEGLTIIVLDEKGYSNSLLKHLGINAYVSNQTVLDEISKLNDRFHPIIKVLIQGGNSSYIDVVMYKPSYIVVSNKVLGGVVGTTSSYAYADTDGNGYYSIGEVMKSYIVIHSWNVGRGKVVLISDLDLWSNDLIVKEGNAKLLKYIVGSERTFMLTLGLEIGLIDGIKFVFMKFRLSRYYGSGLLPLIGFLILMAVLMVVRYAERGQRKV